MEPKRVLSIGRLLVLGDIIMVTLTIITGLVFTQANALNSMHTYSESVSYTFTIILLFTLILSAVAWTMIFFGKKAMWVYIFSIFFNYAPTLAFIWVVNGIENIFGTLRLLVSGAIIYHLWAKEFEAEEKKKPVEKKITDEKTKIESENVTPMKEATYLKVYPDKR